MERCKDKSAHEPGNQTDDSREG